jgi:hypothetical protein
MLDSSRQVSTPRHEYKTLEETTMPSIRQRGLRAAVATVFVPLALSVAALPQAAIAKPVAHALAVKPSATFNTWADKFAEDWVRLNPQLATSTQYFSGAEQEKLDHQLTPLTDMQRQKMRDLARKGVAQLDKYLAGSLDEDQRVSAATMRWSLAKVVEGERFEDYNFVFSQFSGVHVGLVNFLTQTHPLRRASDVDSYLARLDQVSSRIDDALARGRRAAAKSLIPPRFILERAQDQVNNFLKADAAQNVFARKAQRQPAGPEPAGTRRRACPCDPHRAGEDHPGVRPRKRLHGRDPPAYRRRGRHLAPAERRRRLCALPVQLHQHQPWRRADPCNRPARSGAHRRRDGQAPAFARLQRGQRGTAHEEAGSDLPAQA